MVIGKRNIVIAAFALAGCGGQAIPAATPTSNTAILRIYSTTATRPLVQDISAVYTQNFPNMTFDVSTANYATLFQGVTQNGNGFYFISNHLPVDSPLWAAPIGQDGLAIVVSPSNTIRNITTDQLRSIFQGRVANWQELGGSDMPIEVLSRENGSGTRAEFERLVMGGRATTSAARVAPTSEAVMRSIAATPGSIGYVSAGYLSPSVKVLSVNGTPLLPETISANTYPLRTPLFIIGIEEPQNAERVFIAWLQSPDGQAVVSQRYVSLGS